MLPIKFLRWFCKPEYLPDIEGDLLEMHTQRKTRNGLRKANLLLWRDVILLFRPGILRTATSQDHRTMAMLHHNVLISFRNFRRNRTSFFINLTSLTTGLVCALLIFLWTTDELAIDKYHDNDKQLYRVMVNYISPDGIHTDEYTPSPLADALLNEIPGIEYSVSVNPFNDWFKGPGLISHETKQVTAQGIFGSKDLFNVFSYNLLYGDKNTVLSEKNGVVISESLALKLFKTTDNVVGKLVEWNHRMRLEGPFLISGIFKDLPQNSTVQFDAIFNYRKLEEGDIYSNTWNSTYSLTTLLLKEGTDVDKFNKKIAGFLLTKDPTYRANLFVSRYSDKYLYGNYENGVQAGGRISYVKLFALVAIIILAVACINFVNLSTAQASRKMKEVGVKKTLGAYRSTLIAQFLSESVVIAMISLAIAVVITILLLPNFNQIANKHLSFKFTPAIGALVFITGLIAGCYPAFYLSGFKPAAILKGKIAKSSVGEIFIRKGLVIVQFTASIMLIVGFMIVHNQIEFVQSQNLGYSKDNVICFERLGSIKSDDYDAFMHEIKNVPGVVNASSTFGSILQMKNSIHSGFIWEGQNPDLRLIDFPSPAISHDFIETLGIELKDGRTFSKDRVGEDTKIIVNEAAIKMMDLSDPVGKSINYGPHPLEIIGVVKDFHYGSLHNSLDPVFFMYTSGRANIVVKIEAGAERRIIEALKTIYNKFHPGYPFEFTFLDEDYQALYDSETRISKLSTYFAVIATLISCLGLFGLAAFTAERRTKEIGIRKVLGATPAAIIRLLARDLTIPVGIAVLISLPLSYIIGERWLMGFVHRIDLTWWLFASAGAIALLITWITVGLQTLKAARVNPVDSLKSE